MFLKPVLDYYETNSKKALFDVKAAENIRKLLGIIPSLKELRKGLAHRLEKENIVYKIVLDVLGHHLRDSDSPKH
jgi:hypothetical protein